MFFGVKNSRCAERGYTLIDLAMALTIFGLLLSGVATGARVYMKDKQITQTREYTRVVSRAIENFVLEKGRLPCPASINAKMDNPSYGAEADCAGDYNAATKTVPLPSGLTAGSFNSSLGLWAEQSDDNAQKFVVRGMVPFAALNIPEFYAYDSYGNRMMYAVTVSQTDELGFINGGGGGITVMERAGGEGSGGDARRSNHYVVFSMGASANGAWSRYGVEIKPCATTGLDSENCNTLTDSKARYMSARYSLASGGAEFYDDIFLNKASLHMPLWKPTSDTAENIRTVEDGKPVMIKSSASGATPTTPSNVGLEVVGSAQAQKVKSEKYCLYDDPSKCFDPKDLMAAETASTPFACPAGEFVYSVSNGKVNCRPKPGSVVCDGSNEYVAGIKSDGTLDCKTYVYNRSDTVPEFKVGSCGTAHEKSRASVPATPAEICAGGTATSISGGTGAPGGPRTPWTWSCLGSGGGSTASCISYPAYNPTDGECGSANGGTYASVPSSGFCNTGTRSKISGTGPWVWTCKGSNGGETDSCGAYKDKDPINGVCGNANNNNYITTPTTDLCLMGASSSVSGSGPWNWTCAGQDGGTAASCSANKTISGICGGANGDNLTAKPTTDLCAQGVATTVNGSGPWTWTCQGQYGGGNSPVCQANKKENGACGSSNGQSFYSAPSTGLCGTGSASAVTGSGPYSWSCSGVNGGTAVNCSATKKEDASCSGTANACNVGSPTGYNAGACGGSKTWTCVGINGGTNASCSQANAACPINGSCGASNNTCGAGTASGYNAGSCGGSATWSCVGANGGSTASCSKANAACPINGSCGASNNTCGAGTASGYNAGSCGGSATWSCVGANGGSTASCSNANAACAVNGSCGSSANTCNAGSATGYNAGSCGGSATWTCAGANGGSNASCSKANGACAVNGSCGSSNNTCNSGSASGYNAGSCGGSATWTCNGANGGSNASCSKANGACAVNGSCGGSANTCNSGTATGYNAGSCGGSATWTCAGANGGSNASCSQANGACAVNGACGGAIDACSAGGYAVGNNASCGTRTWSCVGSNGGSTASCSWAMGSCGGGGGCFTGTTEVTLADGSRKAIAALVIGDKVKGHTQVNRVESNKPFYVRSLVYKVNGSADAYVTANHPFYTKEGWKAIDVELARKDHPGLEINQLKIGDVLLNEKGEEVVLNKLEAEDHGWNTVYNPTMDGDHTYYAEGLLMHNLSQNKEIGGGGCFTGTTEVTLEDGSTKPISSLKFGDRVKGHTQVNRVTSNKPYYVRSMLYRINDSEDAYVTANHPFYTKDGWKALDAELASREHPGLEISQLKIGDVLLNEKGEEVVLRKFDAEDHGWLIVYNPTMDGDHTYYAKGLLMHNIGNQNSSK